MTFLVGNVLPSRITIFKSILFEDSIEKFSDRSSTKYIILDGTKRENNRKISRELIRERGGNRRQHWNITCQYFPRIASAYENPTHISKTYTIAVNNGAGIFAEMASENDKIELNSSDKLVEEQTNKSFTFALKRFKK